MGMRVLYFPLLSPEIASKPGAGSCSEGPSQALQLSLAPPPTWLDTACGKLLMASCLLPLEQQVPARSDRWRQQKGLGADQKTLSSQGDKQAWPEHQTRPDIHRPDLFRPEHSTDLLITQSWTLLLPGITGLGNTKNKSLYQPWHHREPVYPPGLGVIEIDIIYRAPGDTDSST